MKKWLWRLVLIAAIGGLAFWLWRVFFPNQEKIIRQRMGEVAQLASFASNEGPLAKVANTTKLGTFLAADIEATVDVPGQSQQKFDGRDTLVQAAMSARQMLSYLTVEFLDVTVALGPDKQSAIVNLTLKARTSVDKDAYIQEMKFALKKIDGDWLITQIETVKTLH